LDGTDDATNQSSGGKICRRAEGKPQLVGFLTITSRVGPDEYISIVRIIINIL
jgi:hypothetical protein